VKPSVAVAVLEEERRVVVVIRVVIGVVVETDEEVVLGTKELVLLLEDEATDELDTAARLLYICKRSDPPHYVTVSFQSLGPTLLMITEAELTYSRAFPMQSIVHPVVVSALPGLTVFPQ
jgi:hypothetical protein